MDIKEILNEFEHNNGCFPLEACEEAFMHKDELLPLFRKILEDLCNNPKNYTWTEETNHHVFALMFLALWKDTECVKFIAQLCTLEDELLEDVLGDITTEFLSQIIASICYLRPEVIKNILENEKNSEWTRTAALDAFLILLVENKIKRDEVVSYFAELFRGKLERNRNYVWTRFVFSAIKIYPGELLDEINTALREGLCEEDFADYKVELEKMMLMDAVEAMEELKNDIFLEFINEDSIMELEDWHCFNSEEYIENNNDPRRSLFPYDDRDFIEGEPQIPYVREYPKIGRNEPCVCGSGKKYKKCCGK